MTNEEALNTVNKVIEHGSMDINEKSDSIHSYGFWYAVQSAMEKQTAKKPLNIKEYTYGCKIGLCPICDNGINSFMDYCDKCGQSLKWREEFDEPELEVIDLSAEDVVTASAEDMDDDRPGHGYGDKNHEHKHWKDGEA